MGFRRAIGFINHLLLAYVTATQQESEERERKMIKLSRKLRRNRREEGEDNNSLLPTRDDFRPIDTHEQEELIRSFEQKHAQQSQLWKTVFAGLLLCFMAFLIYSIFSQVSSPWALRYHAYFMSEIDSWVVISADQVAVVVCLMATKGLLSNSKQNRRWILWSCHLSILLAVFWLYQMLRLPKFRWDIIWLPFGPLGGACISLYVDHLLGESSEEIRKLRGYMYSYKAS